MSSNIAVTPGTGAVVSTDEITTLNGGAVAAQQAQRVKVTFGAAGSGTDVSSSNPMPAAIIGSVVVTGAFWQATQPVSAASLPLPTGASTAANQTALNALFPTTLGQKAMVASLAVVIASDQSAVPASQSGTWNITNISGTISLPTGAATSANQSTLNTNIGSSADAIVANGVAGSIASYLRTIKDSATDTTTASPVKIDQTTDGTTNLVRAKPDTSAHALIPAPSTYRLLSAAASTNGANIKASAGTVKGIQGFNAKASAVYLKLYNKASSPTVGTDTPVKTIYLPATAAFALDFGTGVAFATGISIALTGAGADADTTALVAADVLALNVDYH